MAMQYLKNSGLLIFAFSVACFDGANGTSTGNGMSIEVSPSDSSALTDEGSIEVEDADGSPFEFSAMYASIRDIDFKVKSPDECDEDDSVDCEDEKIRFSGPFTIDLFTGEGEPALEDFSLPAGVYKQIDIRFDKSEDAGQALGPDDVLEGTTFVIEGRDVAEGMPIRIKIGLNIEAKFKDQTGISLEEESPKDIVLSLDPLNWLDAISLHDCIADGEFRTEDGVVVIDSDGQNKCKTLEQDLRAQIKDENKLRMSTR